MAVVAKPAQQRFDHGPVTEEVGPFVVVEIAGDDGGPAAVPFFHELEKRVGLFGLEIEIAEFVDQKDVQTGQPFQELARGAVRQRRVHLVEQVLGADELAAVSVLDSFEQDAGRQSGFSDTGRTDEDEVLLFGNEVEFGEGADLFAVDARLLGEGEGLQGPAFGQLGTADPSL
jgi:hypothetical protein